MIKHIAIHDPTMDMQMTRELWKYGQEGPEALYRSKLRFFAIC